MYIARPAPTPWRGGLIFAVVQVYLFCMEQRELLIIGAGISGLAVANFTARRDYLIIEREHEIGGYCRTVKQDGFVWDYSGHFFHFRHPRIEQYLVSRMPAGTVRRIEKSSKILYKDRLVEFPFQKNIHQLPQDEFIDCLYDLYFRDDEAPIRNFSEMLYAKFGGGITERFLRPYNEKLYACELSELDPDAMGRFFPYADVDEVIRNMKNPDNRSYNSTFTYPTGGAIEYVAAFKRQVPDERIALREELVAIDLERRVARTDKREIGFDRLVSSAPFNRLLQFCGIEHDPAVFSSNKVLVFNLGFDRKGWPGVHWVYFPERKYRFYRAGFYDNIFDDERMSLYIEIGMRTGETVDVEAERVRVLEDLRAAGIVTDQQLVSWHAVVLDPAYVHVTTASQQRTTEYAQHLAAHGVHSIGRYGGWKYCAIEDNIIEAIEWVAEYDGRQIDLIDAERG